MATKYYDECYFVNYDSYNDLNFYEVGCQKCPSGYSFGPIIRDNFVLHYVRNGSGTLYLEGKKYPVSAKQIFVLPPDLLAYYEGDMEDPWNYIWIHFNGQKAWELLHKTGISETSPVFTSTDSSQIEECMVDILRHNDEEFICIGNLYRLFQYMVNMAVNRPASAEFDKSLTYVKDIISFITKKYSEPIKIQEIADYCGLDRSYLSKLFKHATNYTPQEYLLFYRMRKATQLLKNHDIPIQNVAYSVGYNDPFAFSKIFKKEIGVSPTQYRKQNLNT